MTQEEAIKKLREALETILSYRLGPQNDYCDIVFDVREVAKEALEKTKDVI